MDLADCSGLSIESEIRPNNSEYPLFVFQIPWSPHAIVRRGRRAQYDASLIPTDAIQVHGGRAKRSSPEAVRTRQVCSLHLLDSKHESKCGCSPQSISEAARSLQTKVTRKPPQVGLSAKMTLRDTDASARDPSKQKGFRTRSRGLENGDTASEQMHSILPVWLSSTGPSFQDPARSRAPRSPNPARMHGHAGCSIDACRLRTRHPPFAQVSLPAIDSMT